MLTNNDVPNAARVLLEKNETKNIIILTYRRA